MELATMYAAARGIPREHVLKVFVAPNDEIDRQSYDTSLVMAVKKQLTERRLSEKIRVLVLTYGMPLRVEAPLAQEADREFAARAAKKMAQAQESIIQLIAAVQRLAQKEPALPDKPAGNQELLRAAESAFRSTAERLGHLEAGAEKQLSAFTAAALFGYGKGRDLPADAGTSRLSPHLHFGELSPRQAWAAVGKSASARGIAASEWRGWQYLTELGWRLQIFSDLRPVR
ncbi:MAG TPA: hypothetical protein PLP17_01595, partial [Oligoflexia bacterium]|nr:hypothetical protein [Oligoflexia bacterium]